MKKFDKPLDTWIEEEKEIPVFMPQVDKRGNLTGLKQGKRKIIEKTMYQRVTPVKFDCGYGNHNYSMKDIHRYIASCSKCMKNKFLRPGIEDLKEGHIIDAGSGEILD